MKALKILKQYNNQSLESRYLYNLAGIMYYNGNSDKAFTCLDRSRELKIKLEENESLAMVYGLYGNFYTIINNLTLAIEYRERAATQ